MSVTTYADQVEALALTMINQWHDKASTVDPIYYDESTNWWRHTEAPALGNDLGAATLCAALWRYGNINSSATEDALFALAVASFDAAITRMNADGSVDNPALPNTQFFLNELASSYLDLFLNSASDGLPLDKAATWRAALENGFSYLMHHGDYNYYANGNIVLGQALLAAKMSKIMGAPTTRLNPRWDYNAIYQSTMGFLYEPAQSSGISAIDYSGGTSVQVGKGNPSQIAGFGWVFTTPPAVWNSEWTDASGFFAEQGNGGTGFDPDYTQVQANLCAELWQIMGDIRAIKYGNALVNKLLPLIDQTTWFLSCLGGTRHQEPWTQFYSSILGVLAGHGTRPDLLSLIIPQLQLCIAKGYWLQDSSQISKAAGMSLAVQLIAAKGITTL